MNTEEIILTHLGEIVPRSDDYDGSAESMLISTRNYICRLEIAILEASKADDPKEYLNDFENHVCMFAKGRAKERLEISQV